MSTYNLLEFKTKFMVVGTLALTTLSGFVGGVDRWFKMLCMLMVADFIFGWASAWVTGKIISKKMFVGGVRKTMMLFMVGLVNQLGITFQFEELRYILIAYYILMEFVSIMEHATVLDVPLPKFIKTSVEKFIEKLEVYEKKE